MTIGGWILFAFFALIIIATADGAACAIETKMGTIVIAIVSFVVIGALLGGMMLYYHSTESGQRAIKSQQSNLDGGLYRTVTVYGYSGEEIRSWTGKFDVTENDQETWFDIDDRRVIIQGGIIINEEEPDK